MAYFYIGEDSSRDAKYTVEKYLYCSFFFCFSTLHAGTSGIHKFLGLDNFNLRTEDLFTDVFTDKEDSCRGIITISDKEIQARSSILVIVASYLIFPNKPL